MLKRTWYKSVLPRFSRSWQARRKATLEPRPLRQHPKCSNSRAGSKRPTTREPKNPGRECSIRFERGIPRRNRPHGPLFRELVPALAVSSGCCVIFIARLSSSDPAVPAYHSSDRGSQPPGRRSANASLPAAVRAVVTAGFVRGRTHATLASEPRCTAVVTDTTNL